MLGALNIHDNHNTSRERCDTANEQNESLNVSEVNEDTWVDGYISVSGDEIE